ncbi:MAG: hypothetical protein J6M34_01720 [Clostridia bacterium]|nr:hypothetical protein [Clostridia bacterium]
MTNPTMVPTYLREFSKDVGTKKDITSFSIVCSCGEMNFEVLRVKIEPEKEKAPFLSLGYHFARQDKNGEYYNQYFTFFGIPVGRRRYLKECMLEPDVVKAKCLHCGKEITLFHSRKHGYDGIALRNQSSIFTYKPDQDLEFYRARKNCHIIVAVRQDLPYAELEEELGEEMTPDLYADLFGEIMIKSLSEDGKIRTIAAFETR